MRRLLAGLLVMVCADPAAAQQNSVTEGRRNDLNVFQRSFLALDSSYAAANRAAAASRLATLAANAGSMSAAAFEIELARIVALADNGHTNAASGSRSRRYTRVPFRLVPFGEQFFVLRSDTSLAELLGARLVAIDGRPIADVRAAVHTVYGGTPAFRDRHTPFLLESPELLQALGITSSASAAVYQFQLRNGRTVNRRIIAQPPDPSRDIWGTSRWLSPEPLDADSGRWQHMSSPEKTPWAFRDIRHAFRTRIDTTLNAVIVQLRSNVNAQGQSIQDFLASARDEILRVKPRHVILDIRTNGGGDLNNTRDFVQALPGLVPGQVFVLTSPWTFSAAISTTGYLEQAGRDRVTIVGEMVGDRLEFWAEGRGVILPYSGTIVSYSTQRHDYKTGCKPYSDCHGSVVRFPIAVPSLAPDIIAPLTIDAMIKGEDPGMDAIARVVRAGGTER